MQPENQVAYRAVKQTVMERLKMIADDLMYFHGRLDADIMENVTHSEMDQLNTQLLSIKAKENYLFKVFNGLQGTLWRDHE